MCISSENKALAYKPVKPVTKNTHHTMRRSITEKYPSLEILLIECAGIPRLIHRP